MAPPYFNWGETVYNDGMRLALTAAFVLATSLTWGETEDALQAPAPLLIQHALWGEREPPTRSAVEWTVVVLGGLGGVGGAVWGLGSALSHLSDPGGPPLGTTITGLAWSTVALAAAGVALEDLLSGP